MTDRAPIHQRAARRVLDAPRLEKIKAGVLGILAGLVGLGVIPILDVEPIQAIATGAITLLGAFFVRP